MSAYQCWVAQRERLSQNLKWAEQPGAIASAVRHTLSQVEQNTMAEFTDDLLRQQTGILFSCCKASLNLLEISVTTQVWVAKTIAPKPKSRIGFVLLAVAALLVLACAGFAYGKGLWELYIPLAVALVLAIIGCYLWRGSRASQKTAQDDLKVSAKPDTEKLLSAIDAQMRALDRYINDFSYLNEQSRQPGALPDAGNLPLMANLLEAAAACEGEAGEDITATAQRLLEGLGLHPVFYSAQDARLFTILPSLNLTRTITPALISRKDGVLLYRGTAAVRDVDPDRDTTSAAAAANREVQP